MKQRKKQARLEIAKNDVVMVLLARVGHVPWRVTMGERIWKAKTLPVGKRLESLAVPLNVFRTARWAGLFLGLGFRSGVVWASSKSMMMMMKDEKLKIMSEK